MVEGSDFGPRHGFLCVRDGYVCRTRNSSRNIIVIVPINLKGERREKGRGHRRQRLHREMRG
jgi:hypothetical protein